MIDQEDPVARLVEVSCSCGGTTTVKVEPGADTAAAECACGRVLLWSGEPSGKAPTNEEVPAVLGISLGDSVDTSEKFS